ncbi:hypothetical protein DVT68_13175 [Dyella solisilvae]|uniref:Rap1a immunity protein domain-containing protein n=2 Tax=Dyella solisilvae TaxID=1920168 RepID=A0A370K5W1_9GAMM|nr:hypothetical protein DVT68_13175 [Dyella solisilvae]
MAVAENTHGMTVKDVQEMSDPVRAYYINGVYDGMNAILDLQQRPGCVVPPGTSAGSLASLVDDQWRVDPKTYESLPAVAGATEAICGLWPQRGNRSPDQSPNSQQADCPWPLEMTLAGVEADRHGPASGAPPGSAAEGAQKVQEVGAVIVRHGSEMDMRPERSVQ